MGKRTVFLGAAIAFILVLAWPSLRSETASALDIFFWLFLILVVSGLALWPSSGSDQSVELGLGRRSWADRIEFGNGGKAAGREDARQAGPPQSSGSA